MNHFEDIIYFLCLELWIHFLDKILLESDYLTIEHNTSITIFSPVCEFINYTKRVEELVLIQVLSVCVCMRVRFILYVIRPTHVNTNYGFQELFLYYALL